jgi:hypothetical protein
MGGVVSRSEGTSSDSAGSLLHAGWREAIRFLFLLLTTLH